MTTPTPILLVRQKHDAKRAGLHYDIRIVIGDKAHSWATKKEMPVPGKPILLFEQPVHDASYALSKRVEIPDGQYGAGVTTLDFAQKGKATIEADDAYHLDLNNGDRYLIKKLGPGKYGDKSWLFLKKKEKTENPYLSKAASFSPDLTPDQMKQLGVLHGIYDDQDPRKNNFFGVRASMKKWDASWIDKSAPQGWYEWYQGYAQGKRTPDDERQMKRWASFRARHVAQLEKADPSLSNLSVQPKRRQALLNWGIAPGIEVEEALEAGSVNKYLDRVSGK